MDDIGGRLTAKDQSVRDQMEATPNLRGAGVIVLIRVEGQCGPKYAWVWMNSQRRFAFDEGSRALTPTVPLLSEASEEEQNQMGLQVHRAMRDLERQLCGPKDQARED